MSLNRDVIESIKHIVDTNPYWNLLDMRVQEAEKGRSRCIMTIGPRHLIKRGTVHGGAIASLADSAVGIALMSIVEKHHFIATVELKINYLSPITQGEIVADARIIHKGSRIAVGEVDLTNNGKLAAKCIATYIISKNRS